ncbi:MAG: hypothetical protein JST38_15495 [Bacteroidetes bacterium]|nr:hypothetical protein [Bacteroidota bacterium]
MSNRIMHGKGDLHVSIEVMLVKEGDFWVALAPALRITGYGKTQAEAKKSFAVEAEIFFEETAKRGTLEKLLIEYGWVLSKGNFQPPVGVDQASVANLLHAQVGKPTFFTSKLAIPA